MRCSMEEYHIATYSTSAKLSTKLKTTMRKQSPASKEEFLVAHRMRKDGAPQPVMRGLPRNQSERGSDQLISH